MAPTVAPPRKLGNMLRLSFATGTEPGKWFTRYREYTSHELATADADDALADVLAGSADLALARVPEAGGDPRIDDTFHMVRLYDEAPPGIAVPKDHILAEMGETVNPPADVADEIVNYRIPDTGVVDVQAVRDALQIVAANVGIVVAPPRPLLKVLSKRQVVPLALADAPPPLAPHLHRPCVAQGGRRRSHSGLRWNRPWRTPNSSRTDTKKKSARAKSLAKQARRTGAVKGKKSVSKQTLSKRKKGSQRGGKRR